MPPDRTSCCGDGVCSNADEGSEWWASSEDDQNCPADCPPAQSADKMMPQKLITADVPTSVFGSLKEVVHDTYHCEDTFEETEEGTVSSPCSDRASAHRPSQWLEEYVMRNKDLLGLASEEEIVNFAAYRKEQEERRKTRWRWFRSLGCRADCSCIHTYPTLPFALPPLGSRVVEFGAGLGQDTRNLATAGYRVLGVEVSAAAAAEAKAISAETLSPDALERFEFLNCETTPT